MGTRPLDKTVAVQSLSRPTLCDSMDCSTLGFPVLHYIPEFTQIHVHRVGDAIQPSHPLSSPSLPTFSLSYCLFIDWLGNIATINSIRPWMHAKSLQSCPTLCNAMDYNPPGSSVHGIIQARILKWVAISCPRGSSQPKDQTWVSHMQADSLLSAKEAHYLKNIFYVNIYVNKRIFFYGLQ